MAQRLQLHSILKALLGSDKVYFQPPTNTNLVYPCIIYKLDEAVTNFANNKPYKIKKRYMVTAIDKNPDSLVPDKIALLAECIFDRFYTANGLNHYVYKIYF